MSNLEHLIENGILAMETYNPNEWYQHMQKDLNWLGNEHITIDDLWTICQYVVYTYKWCLIDDIENLTGIPLNNLEI